MTPRNLTLALDVTTTERQGRVQMPLAEIPMSSPPRRGPRPPQNAYLENNNVGLDLRRPTINIIFTLEEFILSILPPLCPIRLQNLSINLNNDFHGR